jgi:hypothetical protein
MEKNIMGNQLLVRKQEIHPMKGWLDAQGKNTLYDISSWSYHGWWNGWNFGPIPPGISPLIP